MLQDPYRVEYFARRSSTAEEIKLFAEGTLENPQNCVMRIGDKQRSLTPEKAKQFICDVKNGEQAYSFQYMPKDDFWMA